jgi:hypothetical protein
MFDISHWPAVEGGKVMLTEPKNSKTWDLSAIGGRAFAEVREGADVSSVVASALFGRQLDEQRVLSELGKASQLFIPHKPGKENASRQESLRDLTLSIRDALGLSEDFVPNGQLSANRRFRSARQLVNLCMTVMTFDVTLAIPDAWERWLEHEHPTDDELQMLLSFGAIRTEKLPAVLLRPTASLFTLFEDARKLAEPRSEEIGVPHSHRMTWDACRLLSQLVIELYADDPKLRQAHGVPEAAKMKYRGASASLLCSAYFFMWHAALKLKALDNPPPDELLRLGAYMPRPVFAKIDAADLGSPDLMGVWCDRFGSCR